jgi:hypothetical protein
MSGYPTNLNAVTLVQRYDPDLDSFTVLSAIPQAKCYKEVVEIGGVFYVVGGNTLSVDDVQGSTEIYDVSLDMWRTNNYMPPVSAYGIGCAKHNGSLYFCGGNDGTNWLTGFYKYTPSYMEGSVGSGTLSVVSPTPPPTGAVPTYRILNLQLDLDRS